MAQVLLITARASLSCSNCGTTQVHAIELYYDTDTEQLRVEKKCKCDTEGSGYEEVRVVDVEAE